MKKPLTIILLSIILSSWIISCSKTNDHSSNGGNPPGNSELSYGDSVFYLKNQADDYIVLPSQQRSGAYFGFPEGVEIDGNTGAINISKSETGLKYKISFIPYGTRDTLSTNIIISGINFLDGFHVLANGDSIVFPIYNAKNSNSIPGLNNGTIFDEGSNCNSQGCTVNVGDGQINLAQTVRNGVFGATPSNNDRHEFELDYRVNDKSGKALNTLRVKLYYFDQMSDVTQEVYDIIDSRQGTILDASPVFNSNFPIPVSRTASNSVTQTQGKTAKPRPPCIFIVGR